MPHQDPLLRINHLSKIYPGGFQALKDISFEVKRGEFLVVIGLSGSGKSTLLRCLNRLTDPSHGDIFFKGQNISQLPESSVREVRRNFGMVFQQFNLIPRFSCLENVLTGHLGRKGFFESLFRLFSDEEKKQALRALSLLGLQDKAYVRTDQLSGGQQQRVAIARALVQAPEVILADEPVASLDPTTCRLIMDYLKKVNQELGLTIICNLHALSLVREYATQVIALKGGELVFEGPPEKIDDVSIRKIYGEVPEI